MASEELREDIPGEANANEINSICAHALGGYDIAEHDWKLMVDGLVRLLTKLGGAK